MGRAQGSPRILGRWAVREDDEDDEDDEDGDIAGFAGIFKDLLGLASHLAHLIHGSWLIFCYLRYKSGMDCWRVKVLSSPKH